MKTPSTTTTINNILSSFHLLLLLILISSTILIEAVKDDNIFQNKIVGGEDTKSGEFPFNAAWYYRNSRYPSCGGSLIAPNLVLTAAHCSPINGYVRIGCDTIDGSCLGGEGASVIAKIVHPQFSMIRYDIMILVLDRDIKGITPINLNFDDSVPSTNEILTVIGFGTLSENLKTPATTLQKVDVPVVPYSTCLNQYGPIIQSQLHLCAGYREGGKDSCKGDSGGPAFTTSSDGVRTLVGLVSFGAGCARPNASGVYSRVSGAANWLQTEICNRASSSYLLPYCPGDSNKISNLLIDGETSFRFPSISPTPLLTSQAPSVEEVTAMPIIQDNTLITLSPSIRVLDNSISSSSCTSCDDTPPIWMVNQKKTCSNSEDVLFRKCIKNPDWRTNKFCQLSCYYAVDLGYVGDVCCPATNEPTPLPTPSPSRKLSKNPTPRPTADQGYCKNCDNVPNEYMTNVGMSCDTPGTYIPRKCRKNKDWREKKYCRKTCYQINLEYSGDTCCV